LSSAQVDYKNILGKILFGLQYLFKILSTWAEFRQILDTGGDGDSSCIITKHQNNQIRPNPLQSGDGKLLGSVISQPGCQKATLFNYYFLIMFSVANIIKITKP